MLFTACGNSGTDALSNNSSDEEKVLPSGTSSVSELPKKETDKSEPGSIAGFLISEEGLNFQKTASKAAVAYLRNDKERLSQYLVDPNYETGLSEDSKNLIDSLVYMIFKFPSSDVMAENDEVYPVVYEFVIEGKDMIMYLDMGLRLTDSGWKVEYIDLQG